MEIQPINNFVSTYCRKKPVYAISGDEQYKRFESEKEASEFFGISPHTISDSTIKNRVVYGKQIFVSADKIERENPVTGAIEADLDAIRKKAEKIRLQGSTYARRKNKKSLYLIDGYGNYTKHDSLCSAAKETGTCIYTLSKAVSGGRKEIRGYMIALPEEIEIQNPDGSTDIDLDKIREISKKLMVCPEEEEIENIINTIPICAISPTGRVKTYSSIQELCENSGIKAQKEIYECAQSDNNILNNMGFMWKDKLFDTDTGEINTAKLRVMVRKINCQENSNPIYIYDSESNTVRRFINPLQASKKYHIPASLIQDALKQEGFIEDQDTYCVLKASNYEKYDENGTLVADTGKMLKRITKIKQKLKR